MEWIKSKLKRVEKVFSVFQTSSKMRPFYAETLVDEIMSSHLVVIYPYQTYRDAVELLTQNRLTVLPVIDSFGKYLGMLTEKNILKGCSLLKNQIFQFLDHPIQFDRRTRGIFLGTPLHEVHHHLIGSKDRHVPIIDSEGFLKGMMTRRDLIRILYVRLEFNPERIHEV